MCVALPGVVVWMGRPENATHPGRVRIGARELDVDLVLVPDVRIGDWVIAHSGYALRRVPDEVAAESWDAMGRALTDAERAGTVPRTS
jgi:hydrogenase expression/formation protein HypC